MATEQWCLTSSCFQQREQSWTNITLFLRCFLFLFFSGLLFIFEVFCDHYYPHHPDWCKGSESVRSVSGAGAGLQGAKVNLDGGTCVAALWTRGRRTPKSLQELKLLLRASGLLFSQGPREMNILLQKPSVE